MELQNRSKNYRLSKSNQANLKENNFWNKIFIIQQPAVWSLGKIKTFSIFKALEGLSKIL